MIAYIDGFNLYYGMRSKGWRRYYWLNLHSLAERLLRAGQTLTGVKYFTARVVPDTDSVDKARRQNVYLEASLPCPTCPSTTGITRLRHNDARNVAQCGRPTKRR